MSYDELPEQLKSDVRIALQLQPEDDPPDWIKERIYDFYRICCNLTAHRTIDPQVLALLVSLPGNGHSPIRPKGPIPANQIAWEEYGGKHVEATIAMRNQKVKRLATIVGVGQDRKGQRTIKIRFDDDTATRDVPPEKFVAVKELPKVEA